MDDVPLNMPPRYKTSLSLSPTAAKALARVKYELLARYDDRVSQGEILDAILLDATDDLEGIRDALRRHRVQGPE